MVARRAPEECADMREVRAQIDRIDEQLVALLAERFGFVERAWQVKKAEGKEGADVPWRVQQVVDRVRAAAERCGLPPDLAAALWSKMITYFIEYEAEKIGGSEASGEEGGGGQGA